MITTDLILLILIALFAVIGFFKGFIKSFGFLVGEILAILLAARLYLIAGNILNKFIGNINISNIVGSLLVFVIFSIIFRIIVEIVAKIFHLPIINFINRMFGLLFGIFEISFIIGFTLSLLLKYPLTIDMVKNITEKSIVAPMMMEISGILTPLLPKELTDIQAVPGFIDLQNMQGLENIPGLQEYLDSTSMPIDQTTKTYGAYGVSEPI